MKTLIRSPLLLLLLLLLVVFYLLFPFFLLSSPSSFPSSFTSMRGKQAKRTIRHHSISDMQRGVADGGGRKYKEGSGFDSHVAVPSYNLCWAVLLFFLASTWLNSWLVLLWGVAGLYTKWLPFLLYLFLNIFCFLIYLFYFVSSHGDWAHVWWNLYIFYWSIYSCMRVSTGPKHGSRSDMFV